MKGINCDFESFATSRFYAKLCNICDLSPELWSTFTVTSKLHFCRIVLRNSRKSLSKLIYWFICNTMFSFCDTIKLSKSPKQLIPLSFSHPSAIDSCASLLHEMKRIPWIHFVQSTHFSLDQTDLLSRERPVRPICHATQNFRKLMATRFFGNVIWFCALAGWGDVGSILRRSRRIFGYLDLENHISYAVDFSFFWLFFTVFSEYRWYRTIYPHP